MTSAESYPHTGVAVNAAVGVGMGVSEAVAVTVGDGVIVEVGVDVGVGDAVGTGVLVGLGVDVSTGVSLGTGVSDTPPPISVGSAVGVACTAGALPETIQPNNAAARPTPAMPPAIRRRPLRGSDLPNRSRCIAFSPSTRTSDEYDESRPLL